MARITPHLETLRRRAKKDTLRFRVFDELRVQGEFFDYIYQHTDRKIASTRETIHITTVWIKTHDRAILDGVHISPNPNVTPASKLYIILENAVKFYCERLLF